MLVGDIVKILDPSSRGHVNYTWKQHIPNRTFFGQPLAPDLVTMSSKLDIGSEIESI